MHYVVEEHQIAAQATESSAMSMAEYKQDKVFPTQGCLSVKQSVRS